MKKINSLLNSAFLLLSIFFLYFFLPSYPAFAACTIKSATFSPHGDQLDDWYGEGNKPVKLTVEGIGCKGASVTVKIVQDITAGLDPSILTKTVIFQENAFTLDLTAGSAGCSDMIGVYDCKYYAEISSPTISSYSSAGKTGGTLNYEMGDYLLKPWSAGAVTYIKTDSPDDKPTANEEKTHIYNLISPLPCGEDMQNCGPDGKLTVYDAADTNNSGIGNFLNILIKIFIGICAALAVIMIVIGGVEYMTIDLVSSKEAAKSRITGAILGLLLALGSWTILNEINPNLLKTDFSNLKGVIAEVDLTIDEAQIPVNGKYSNGTAVGANWETTSGMARSNLPAWVTVNSSECQKVGDTNCTSTRGLTGTYLNKIHEGCPSCQLIITGGTEFWLHGGKTGSTSHKPGNPTVDLRVNPELTKYIAGDKKLIYFHRYEKDGLSFLYEKDHWHVGP